jgi:hypothetical protein
MVSHWNFNGKIRKYSKQAKLVSRKFSPFAGKIYFFFGQGFTPSSQFAILLYDSQTV